MRVLPEVLMLLLTSAIVATQCLQPADKARSKMADASGERQESALAYAAPSTAPAQPALSLAMAPAAHFDDPCPSTLLDDDGELESLADQPAVAITFFDLPEKT